MNHMAGRKKHSAEGVVRKLRRPDELAGAGKTNEEIAAELEVSAATLYNWRRAYGGIDLGVDEARYATAYPEQAGAIIIALVQALQDAMAQQLLAAARPSPDAPRTADLVATYGAYIEAIERYLGVPAGALYRAESRTMNGWVTALRRADSVATGRTR
jgi:transposase-like protein